MRGSCIFCRLKKKKRKNRFYFPSVSVSGFSGGVVWWVQRGGAVGCDELCRGPDPVVMRTDAVPSSLCLAGGVVWYSTVVVLASTHCCWALCHAPMLDWTGGAVETMHLLSHQPSKHATPPSLGHTRGAVETS